MELIRPLTLTEMPDSIRDDLEMVVQAYGQLPRLYATMAHAPNLMQCMWHLGLSAIMDNELAEEVKRAAAVVACEVIGSKYLLTGQMYAIYQKGWSREEVKALRTGDYPDRAGAMTRAACELARRIAVDVKADCTEQIAALRDVGATDAAIVEILGAISFIRFNAAFAEVLQLPPEGKAPEPSAR